MRKIFVDTGAWDAIADSGDLNHEPALLFRDEIAERCHLISSNYVLDELFTLLLMNIGYRHTLTYKNQLDVLIEEGVLEIVWVTKTLASKAWDVFAQFNVDKAWSFTDCTSYVIMKDMEINEVFAFDHHFKQMGFIRRP